MQDGGTTTKEEEAADMRFGIQLGSLKDVVQADGHVNFFQDVEAGKRQGTVNEDHEQEKRQEQEDYEKKIGYLVYLGQGSTEQSNQQPWYASKIDRDKPVTLEQEVERQKVLDNAATVIGGLQDKTKNVTSEEMKMTKVKSFLDPLKDFRSYMGMSGIQSKLKSFSSSSKRSERVSGSSSSSVAVKSNDFRPPKKKSKKDKHKSSKKSKKTKKSSKYKKRRRGSKYSSDSSHSTSADSEDDRKQAKLEKLRAERLQREREERRKANRVLSIHEGGGLPSDRDSDMSKTKADQSYSAGSSMKQKYNSQFNPHLARQNYE